MKNLLSFSPVFVAMLAVWSTARPALAQVAPAPTTPVTLFNENFNGYTNFPDRYYWGDRVNHGIPNISEGASQFWYGVRFSTQNGGTIDSDLAVLRMSDSNPVLNNNPVGWFEDGAGLALRIDTTGFQNVNLSFDWRTVFAQGNDRFVVGYHVGDDLGFDTASNRYLDLRTGAGEWGASWVQLLRNPASDSFRRETFQLPANAGPVYVAFWLYGGEGNYGKLDNVLITAAPIPEPAALTIVMFGMAMLAAGRKLKP